MTTLSSHVSPYTSTERLPADPPTEAVCVTCDAEWSPAPSDAPSLECPNCAVWRTAVDALSDDEVIRLLRDLEDDAAWHRRRLAGHMAACRGVGR